MFRGVFTQVRAAAAPRSIIIIAVGRTASLTFGIGFVRCVCTCSFTTKAPRHCKKRAGQEQVRVEECSCMTFRFETGPKLCEQIVSPGIGLLSGVLPPGTY